MTRHEVDRLREVIRLLLSRETAQAAKILGGLITIAEAEHAAEDFYHSRMEATARSLDEVA